MRRVPRFTREMPVHWTPEKVTNPDSPIGLCFSASSAWHFLADTLERGHEFKEVLLQKSVGGVAYEVAVVADRGAIYIKVQFMNGKLIARSFHRSDRH